MLTKNVGPGTSKKIPKIQTNKNTKIEDLVFDLQAGATGYYCHPVNLFAPDDSQTITGNGCWMAIGRYLSPTVTIQGLETGGVISIRVSNNPEEDKPADDDYGVPHNILGNVVADMGASLGGSFVWIRAMKTAGPSPTATKVYSQSQIAK